MTFLPNLVNFRACLGGQIGYKVTVKNKWCNCNRAASLLRLDVSLPYGLSP